MENNNQEIIKEEKNLFERYLINSISRILDLREIEKNVIQSEKRIRKVMNKYTKKYRKKKDIKKVFSKQEKIINLVSIRDLEAVSELIDIIDMMLNDNKYNGLFRSDLPELEAYYQFDMEDMVFVNGILRELKSFNSKSINISIILNAINKAIKEYVECIDNDEDYLKCFEDTYPFISISKREEVE